MIDFDKIDAKCKAYLNSVGRSCSTILDVNEIKELVAYARQAEKDAARYRWLRDTGCFEGGNDDFFHATPAQTDAAIDEAMQCK